MVKPLSPERPLILASGSRFRAELLARLRVPFQAISPNIDETPRADEDAATLARRLALAKARALQPRFPEAWILGSDQAVSAAGFLLGKPGTRARAAAQLRLLSGLTVEFATAATLVRGEQVHAALDRTLCRFRRLGHVEIERYLDAEDVLDCAGSFRCEGLGITLFEAIESRDPTALIGLPLIAVRQLLAQAGLGLP